MMSVYRVMLYMQMILNKCSALYDYNHYTIILNESYITIITYGMVTIMMSDD